MESAGPSLAEVGETPENPRAVAVQNVLFADHPTLVDVIGAPASEVYGVVSEVSLRLEPVLGHEGVENLRHLIATTFSSPGDVEVVRNLIGDGYGEDYREGDIDSPEALVAHIIKAKGNLEGGALQGQVDKLLLATGVVLPKTGDKEVVSDMTSNRFQKSIEGIKQGEKVSLLNSISESLATGPLGMKDTMSVRAILGAALATTIPSSSDAK